MYEYIVKKSSIAVLVFFTLFSSFSITNQPVFAVGASLSTPIAVGAGLKESDISTLCKTMNDYGSRFIWLTVPWNAIEPVKDTYAWNLADSEIQMVQNCGFEIGVHILSRSSWATQPVPPTVVQNPNYVPSMPPYDINDYYNFVYQFTSHFNGKITRYSVENEAHASEEFAGSPADYALMLQTAYRAVHTADPAAKVEDSALSSTAFGLLIINDKLIAGNDQDALTFAQHYFAYYSGLPSGINSVSDLQYIMSQSETQRLLAWSPMLYANHAYFDIEQLHYFGPWDSLKTVTDWVHTHLQAYGDDKSLDFWEFGYGWTGAPANGYEPVAHAKELTKLFATAFGEGALRVEQWQFNDYAISEGHPGLFDANGSARPAAAVYKLLSGKLNGATSVNRLNLSSPNFGYSFVTPSGTVFVVWSLSPSTISLPIASQNALITDIYGNTSSADRGNIPVSDIPVFVEAVVIPGDVDGSGHVNIIDLSLLLSSFGKKQGDSGFNANADFDHSGQIGIGDLSILLTNFGK